MSDSTMARMATMGRVRLRSGGVAPQTLVVPYDLGNLKATGIKRILNETVDAEANGQYVSSWYGKRLYPQLSFDSLLGRLSSLTDEGIIRDFLNGQGFYGSNVSTLGEGRIHAVHVDYLIDGTDFTEPDEVLTFEHFHPETQDLTIGLPTTWSFGGKVYGRVLKDGEVIAEPYRANAA